MSNLQKLITGPPTKGKQQEKIVNTSENMVVTAPNHLLHTSMSQGFCLVWLDENIEESENEDYLSSFMELCQIVSSVHTFTNVDKCIDFITNFGEQKVLLVSTGIAGQILVPVVHDETYVGIIYIFGENIAHYEKWAQQWGKIKGAFTDIISIYDELEQIVQDCRQNSIAISFPMTTLEDPNENLNELDPSFMYTQILKEVLLTMKFEQRHMDEFLTYCRQQFDDNVIELRNIDKFEKEYRHHQPIRPYTYPSFLYSMLNYALRTLDVDLITKMGFFLQDLHQHVVTLHSEKDARQNSSNSFIVYRGQGLSQEEFDQMTKVQGGLLAFNSFLFTNKIRDVSLKLAQRIVATSDLVGVLFVMTIDPSIPFADQTKNEILLSMNSIFRIGEIKQIDGNVHLWEVELTLTTNSNSKLHALTERMREETKGSSGEFRLGTLMIQLAQYNKAEHLYNMLLGRTSDEREEGDILFQLGLIKFHQRECEEAITLFQKSVQLREKLLTPLHPDVAECYNDMGIMYSCLGQSTKALWCYRKALEIREKTLPPTHPDIASSIICSGLEYDQMRQYSKALPYYEKGLGIFQQSLPLNHPYLASAYSNIAEMHLRMSKYAKAFPFYERALDIRQRSLPVNHPDLANAYHNIGVVYEKMGDYLEAVLFYKRALEIRQHSLPTNHPKLASLYNRIGSMYDKMDDYSEAVVFCERALEIAQHVLPPDNPLSKDIRKRMTLIKEKM